MRLPLISVIITTYNYAHTVGTAIRSALSQDYPNLEVVVIDNASTDATPALVATFASDPRLKYVRNPENIGMIPNHNEGLRHASGEYVAFLSADDFLMSNFVSRSYAYLGAHPEIDVLYGATYFVDEHERFSGVRQMAGQPLGAYEGGRNELAWLLVEGCYMCFPTMLMRRDLYERYGMLDESIKAADYEIVLRWAEHGVRFAYDPEPVAGVRIHGNQQSSVGNYLVDGGDIREFLYFIRKFIRPETEHRFAGFETRISNHLGVRYSMAKQTGFNDETVAAEIAGVSKQLEEVRQRNLARRQPPKLTVIVLAGTRIDPLSQSLESLVAQTHDDWEAIVVQNPGTSWAPLARYHDPRGRIRTLRMFAGQEDGVRLNNALRIAAGNCFAFMHAGTTWAPDHAARLVGAFGSEDVNVVLCSAALAIEQVVGEITNRRRVEYRDDLFAWAAAESIAAVGSDIPLDALACTLTAIDRVGNFNESLPAFEDWEIYLRLATAFRTDRLPSQIEMLEVLGLPDRHLIKGTMPAVARALYDAYPSNDPTIVQRRALYLKDLEALVARAAAGTPTTPDGFVDIYYKLAATRFNAAPIAVESSR